MNKRKNRLKRAKKTREIIKKAGIEKGTARLNIFRSSQHIYAQIISPTGGNILASASTRSKAFKDAVKTLNADDGKVGQAKIVGQLLANDAKTAEVGQVACDRSGFKYHGRIAALVESAREHGLIV